MPGGYAGKILFINLTTEIVKEKIREEVYYGIRAVQFTVEKPNI